MTWEPIDTAPKDGTEVDLYVSAVVPRGGEERPGYRLCNCQWAHEVGSESDPEWLDQWGNPVEEDFHGGAYVATHWMPVIEPPR